MLKIQHPASIVRDREKQVSNWEGVRWYKYSNGVECQILMGQLPHGHVQSAISANREFTIQIDGKNAAVVFSDTPAPLVNFLEGERPTAVTTSSQILDSCGFVHSTKVKVKHGGEVLDLKEDGPLLVATFTNGATVKVEPHGGHGHVEASREGAPLKTFYNEKDNTLYVFEA